LIEIVGSLPECKNNAKSDRCQQKQDRAEDLKRFPSDLLNAPLAASVEGNYAPRHQGLLQSRKLDSKCALPDCAGSDKMVFVGRKPQNYRRLLHPTEPKFDWMWTVAPSLKRERRTGKREFCA
jgi:hypothetical protein